jgi:hypothetical protein
MATESFECKHDCGYTTYSVRDIKTHEDNCYLNPANAHGDNGLDEEPKGDDILDDYYDSIDD